MSETNQKIQKLEWTDAIANGITGISGKKYMLESELSMDRYIKLQEYIIELTTGSTAQEMIAAVGRAYEYMQNFRAMDAGEELRRVLVSSATMAQYPHPAHKAVALLFNSTDETLEDRMAFDETKMMVKIEDWKHYGVTGFFQLLANTAPGLRESWSANSDGSQTKN